jgi:hypothetical protein
LFYDEEILTTKTFFVAAILVTEIFAISQIPSNAAMVDGNNYGDDQIPSSVTIPLECLTLKIGQFIDLTDTTPILVTAAAHAITITYYATMAIIMIQNLILPW